MTFLSLTQVCRQLGVDAKTVHRWLALAQLSLQAHPTDARLKGLSREQMQHLATLHHRCLLDLPQPPLASAPAASCALPAALLTLPQTLSSLQAQLSALQQQVAELTQLIQHARAVPAEEGAVPLLTEEPPPSPAVVPAPTPPAKAAHVLPLVEYVSEGRYVVICPQNGLLPFEPESPQWRDWLLSQTAFRFVGQHGRLTAHCERYDRGTRPWRAHRKIRNHTYNLPLAPSEALTLAVLEQAAAALQALLA